MSVIDKILSDERWYGDGPPTWKQKGKTRKPDTAKYARLAAAKLAGWLSKADRQEFPKAEALGTKLERCRTRHRCQSLACPMCARAYQRWIVTELHRHFGDSSNPRKPTIAKSKRAFKKLTVIVEFGKVEFGQLDASFLTAANNKMKAIVDASGCSIAFGSREVSVEEYASNPVADHYAAHYHLMVLAEEYPAFKKTIKPHFVGKKVARVPLIAKNWKYDKSGISYLFQHAMDRRRKVIEKETQNPLARVEQAVEIALALNELGFKEQTILVGLRRYVHGGEVKLKILPDRNQGFALKQVVDGLGPVIGAADPTFDQVGINNYSPTQAATLPAIEAAKHRAKRAKRAIRSSSRHDTMDQQETATVAEPFDSGWNKSANIVDLLTGIAFERFSFFDVNGKQSECVVRREVAIDPPLLRKELAKANARFPPREKMQQALQGLIDSQASASERAVPQVGWTDDGTAFSTPIEIIGQTLDGTAKRIPPLNLPAGSREDAHPAGTLDEWQTHIAEPAKYSSRVMMLIAAGFAAPLLRTAGLQPFGIHLYGSSKSGKSAAQSAAASISGRGAESDLPSFNATENVLLELARRKNDRLCVVNDVSIKKGGQSEIYMVLRDFFYASSGGKARERLEDTTHFTPPAAANIRAILVTSGERSVDAYAQVVGAVRDQGEIARVLDLPALSARRSTLIDTVPRELRKTFNIARRRKCLQSIRSGSAKHHGVAFGPYIKFLLGIGLSEVLLESRIQRILPQLESLAGKQAERVHMARNVALIFAGGHLAIEAKVLPWSVRELRRAIVRCFSDAMSNLPTPQAAALSPSQLLSMMNTDFHFEHPLSDTWQLSSCGKACRRETNNVTVLRVHSAYLKKKLGHAGAPTFVRWLFDQGMLVETKVPFIAKRGIEWAVRTPRWPNSKKVRSIEFRLPV